MIGEVMCHSQPHGNELLGAPGQCHHPGQAVPGLPWSLELGTRGRCEDVISPACPGTWESPAKPSLGAPVAREGSFGN